MLPGGRTDVTLEAVAYGGVSALRAVALVLVLRAVYAAAVDPDEVLRACGASRSARRSPPRWPRACTCRCWRATPRAWPRRSAAAPAGRPRAVAIVRAVAAGALDRAVDVAAALEVRGYGAARRPAALRRGRGRATTSRFAAAALALVARWRWRPSVAGLAHFDAYPAARTRRWARPSSRWRRVIVALALAPFAERRGIVR